MKTCLFCLLFCLTISVVQAQRGRVIDSLEKTAARQKDTALVKTYNELTWEYRLVNQQKAIDYGNKAIQLSQQLQFDKGLSQAYNDLGIIYYDRQEFGTALSLYNKALQIRKKSRDLAGIAKLYNKIGIVHQRAGEFDEALSNQLQALALFEQLNDDFGVSYSLNNIAIINQNLGRYDDAIRYQEQSIRLKEKIGDRIGLAGSYVNVANIHTIREDYSKAKEYFMKAERISRELGNREYLSNALNNLGHLMIRTKNFKEALPYATESFDIRKNLGDIKGMVSCLNNIAFIHYSMDQLPLAETHYNRALALAKGQPSCKPEMPSLYKNMSLLYEKMNEGDKALTMHKLYADTKDSLFTSDLNNRFAELQARYENLEKEKKIALLNKDNSIKALEIRNQELLIRKNLFELTQKELALSQADLVIANDQIQIQDQNETILRQKLDATQKAGHIDSLRRHNEIQQLEIQNRQLQLNRRNLIIGCLGAFVAMGLLLGYSYYRRYRLKQEARMQAAVLRQQELATKAVLEAEEAERQRIAKDLHDGVGQMMSAAKMNLSAYEHEVRFQTEDEQRAFERIISLVDESCREVRAVSHNMMPNALLKGSLASAVREFIDKLDHKSLKVHLYAEGLDERLDSNTETVLYRVIQECVNNVIKHAGADKLDIAIIKDSNEITATVEDNGRGFDVRDRAKFDGIGLKNIRTRVEYLKGTVDFDSTPGRGTLVALHIPL